MLQNYYSPEPAPSRFVVGLNDLLYWLQLRRPLRVALVGRRGAGKTSLLNAIFRMKLGNPSAVRPGVPENSWRVVRRRDARRFEVLDTLGFQATNQARPQDVQNTIQLLRKKPDILLFLIKAKEVDSASNADLGFLEMILNSTRHYHRSRIPVLAIVSQCDEVDPPGIHLVNDRDRNPHEWEQKITNIQAAMEILRHQMGRQQVIYRDLIDIVPTAAFVRFLPDGTFDPDARTFLRWNVDHLTETMIRRKAI